jgi:hypothetical protein
MVRLNRHKDCEPPPPTPSPARPSAATAPGTPPSTANAALDSASAGKDEQSGHCGSADGRRPVLNRDAGQSALSRRSDCVGKSRFEDLPFRRDSELWNHKERCVYVQARCYSCGISRREE